MVGILWHQGESDSQAGKYKEYYEKMIRLFHELRTELSVPNIPLVIGGLGDFLGKTAFGAGCVEYQLMNEELKNMHIIMKIVIMLLPKALHLTQTEFTSMRCLREYLVQDIMKHFEKKNIYMNHYQMNMS
nr:sialate O-acetylesterase [Bacillus safensis]